ncbi:hypothetical protein OS493_039193 [Desmophyllum pertusum]|uniref:TauD/TfdA-like domain-containing protein n=1 Tax=Desmophyllum pertusum TaxID=174260 RepID=A0A9X0D7Z2_9CNID|nr:hypothetical protein OS493_039193 [Desmophyllum pertusum]
MSARAMSASFQRLPKMACVIKGLIRRPLTQTATYNVSIFEPIPREELVTKFKSRLRDRPLTPGSSNGGFPEFLAEPRESFPLGVRVRNSNQFSLAELTAKCMEFVEENLSHNPAILFRGLPARSAEDFSIIAQGIPWKGLSYEGGVGGNRRQVDKVIGTYTASDEPPEFTIEPHNEMAYNAVYPAKSPMMAVVGKRRWLRTASCLSKLDPDVVRKFEEKQVRYVRYLPDKSRGEYQNWQHVFATTNKKDIEPIAKEQGYNITWDPTGDLYLWQNGPVSIQHPLTGEKVWFNQAHQHNATYYKTLPAFAGANIPDEKLPCHTYYGDGSVISPEAMQHLRATSWSCAVGFQWRSSDLLVVDNLAAQHARMSFTGDRINLVYLTE